MFGETLAVPATGGVTHAGDANSYAPISGRLVAGGTGAVSGLGSKFISTGTPAKVPLLSKGVIAGRYIPLIESV